MSATLTTTPAADGFRMPAEWDDHAGCYLVWPERTDNWRLGAKPAQRAWRTLIETIADGRAGHGAGVGARSTPWRAGCSPRTCGWSRPRTNDAWVRDTGPSFVVNDAGDVRGVSWSFNAWGGLRGGLYFPWDADDLVGPKICDLERVPVYRPDLVLEGGSIDIDGEGTVLTTEECLLNDNRNPHLSREQIEEQLHAHLGTSKVIWLPRGVFLDETDGHIDNFARFAAPGVVMLTWTDDESRPAVRALRRGARDPRARDRRRGPSAARREDPPARSAHHHRRGGRRRRRRARGRSRASRASGSPAPT